MSATRHAGGTAGSEQAEAHGGENPAPEAAMSRDTINLPDNVIQDGISGYTEEQQDAIQWLFSYARSELGGSRERLCNAVDADWTTIIRIVQGKYPASIDGFIARVKDLQRRAASSGGAGFVETIVTRKVFDLLDTALAGDMDGGLVSMMVADTRRGKTSAVREWCRRNNHGRSVYIDAPESGGLRALLYEIADATGVNASRKTVDLRDRIIRSFNRRRILIVDEASRITPTRWTERVVEIEFLRRLHDRTGCALVLIYTPAGRELLEHGPMHRFLAQFFGRVKEPLVIPDAIRRDEAREIAAAFCSGRQPSDGLARLAHQIGNQPGKLDLLFGLLRQAAVLARKRGEALKEDHLAAAWKRRQERMQWPQE